MTTLKGGAMFAGYGGLELGISQVLNIETTWVAEFDAAPSRILAQRFPDVPNLGDVTAVDWAAVEPVDIITGGSPCQDVSHAGKRAGMRAGTRSGLWASMCDAIEIIRPRLVVWENVRGALSAEADSAVEPCPICVGDGNGVTLRALGRVLGDLAELGYDAAWTGIRAADVGAPHGRFRVFVLAWPSDTESDPRWLDNGDRRTAANTRSEVGQQWPGLRTDEPTGHRGGLAARGCGAPDGAAVNLLPTPRATDGTKGGPNQRGSSGDLMLPSAVTLLPTPTALSRGKSTRAMTSSSNNGRRSGGGQSSPLGLEEVAQLLDGNRPAHLPADEDLPPASRAIVDRLLPNGLAHAQAFGQYAPAVARWEAVLDRQAPAPTEQDWGRWEKAKHRRLNSRLPVGMRGSIGFLLDGPSHRLSPRFVEWLMGLPEGWVTDTDTTRNEQLKALGNGVVPQQASAAVRHLLAVRSAVLAGMHAVM